MTWLHRLTDRLALHPTTHAIDPGSLQREMIPAGEDHIEAWTTETNPDLDPKVVVIKFIGNGGRAERSTAQPASLWSNTHAKVWSINPFGYGGSSGIATLQRFPEMVDAVYNHIRNRFPDLKIVVFGNSIGSISALRMAAKYPVDGLCIRNPVPIHQLLSRRPKYALPTLGLSNVLAWQVPQELNAVKNARAINAPALFVSLTDDRTIPPRFQAEIIDVYAGEKNVFSVPGDHDAYIPEPMHDQYRAAVNWLLQKVLKSETNLS